MLTPEQLRNIQRIELYSRRLVYNVFAGAYRSAFKGRGIAFHTIRPYVHGDDIRILTGMSQPALVKHIPVFTRKTVNAQLCW